MRLNQVIETLPAIKQLQMDAVGTDASPAPANADVTPTPAMSACADCKKKFKASKLTLKGGKKLCKNCIQKMTASADWMGSKFGACKNCKKTVRINSKGMCKACSGDAGMMSSKMKKVKMPKKLK